MGAALRKIAKRVCVIVEGFAPDSEPVASVRPTREPPGALREPPPAPPRRRSRRRDGVIVAVAPYDARAPRWSRRLD